MATLEQFLRTGVLGPIHLRMTPAEAIACLGRPEDESVAREPRTLKYGALQLHFARCQPGAEAGLTTIALHYHPVAGSIPALTCPTDFAGTASTTKAEVREFLARVGLKEAAIVESEDAEDASYIIMPSGARITFDGSQLHSIISTLRSKAWLKKQISLSLSDEVWQRLRTLAKQSHQSVAELCAGWITQHVGAPPDRTPADHR